MKLVKEIQTIMLYQELDSVIYNEMTFVDCAKGHTNYRTTSVYQHDD